MAVDLPEKAADWPFEAKAAALCEVNTTADIRAEIDAIAGIENPNWNSDSNTASQLTKHELTLILLALGGPQ